MQRPARIADRRGRQAPAIVGAGQQRRAGQPDRALVDRAASGDADAIGIDLRLSLQFEQAAALARQAAPDRAAPIDEIGIGGETAQQHAADAQPARLRRRLERGARRIEQDRCVERAAPHGDDRRPFETGAVGGQFELDLLDVAHRLEADIAGDGTADRQLTVEAAGDGADVAAGGDARHGEIGDAHYCLPALGQQNDAAPGEGAERRSALRRVAIAIGVGDEVGVDIAQAQRIHRPGEHQVNRRPFDIAVERQGERTILIMLPLTLQMQRAVAKAHAIARQRQQGRGEAHVGERQRAIRAERQVAARRGQTAAQCAQEIIIEPPHPRRRAAAEAKAAIGARHGAQFGGDIDHPEAADREADDLAIQAHIITAGLEIGEDGQLAAQLVGAQVHRVADDLLPVELQHAVEREIAHDAFDQIALPVQAARAQAQRDQGRAGADRATLALGAHVADAGLVERQFARGEEIFIAKLRQRAIEADLGHDIAPTHRLEQGFGAGECEVEPHIVERIVAQVDRAVSAEVNRGGAQRCGAVDHPVDQGAVGAYRQAGG